MSEVRCVLECTDIDVIGRVTGGAILSCRQMIIGLADSGRTVMTGFAGIRDSNMGERCW